MGRYRRKSSEVEAYQLDHSNAEELARWCGGKIVREIDPFDADKTFPGINMPTYKGVQRVSVGDYIVRDESGGFEKMSSLRFEGQYQEQ